MGEIFDTI
jgi:ATP-binding cassette subfamily B (MDR/TAP) protein 1